MARRLKAASSAARADFSVCRSSVTPFCATTTATTPSPSTNAGSLTSLPSAMTRVVYSLAELGSLQALVNNAGYGLIGAVEECDDDQIRRNVETNFFGPMNVIRAALPMLRYCSRASQRCSGVSFDRDRWPHGGSGPAGSALTGCATPSATRTWARTFCANVNRSLTRFGNPSKAPRSP